MSVKIKITESEFMALKESPLILTNDSEGNEFWKGQNSEAGVEISLILEDEYDNSEHFSSELIQLLVEKGLLEYSGELETEVVIVPIHSAIVELKE